MNITRIIHNTALSIPRALASRATQTKSAIFRTKMMIGIARNVLHMAHPATCEAASDDCARAGRTKTLNAAIAQATLLNLICIPVVKRYHGEWRGCNCVRHFFALLKPVTPRKYKSGTDFSLCLEFVHFPEVGQPILAAAGFQPALHRL